MIPKKIHYCWFGRGDKSQDVIKCIASWKKYLPEYEIVEWNEENFDLDAYSYAREAYDNRKFAFVADVARLYALYHEGGIYMDTDVEVLKSLDCFLHNKGFVGFEDGQHISTALLGAEKGSKWVKDNLDKYLERKFILDNGQFDMTTNVKVVTDYFVQEGLIQNNSKQKLLDSLMIYSKDYFSPKSYQDGQIYLTDNTYAIHHFAGSWIPPKKKIVRVINYLFGTKTSDFLVKVKHRLGL